MKPTLHLLGLFHTIPAERFSHCAFTGKVLRFSKMMRMQGYEVTEYSNEGSESSATVQRVMLTTEEYDRFYPPRPEEDFIGGYASMSSPGYRAFSARLLETLITEWDTGGLKRGDIICHPFGPAHKDLISRFPECIHVETGIGYPSTGFGCDARIFESDAWRHWHLGKHNTPNDDLDRHYVVPNYYDVSDWPIVTEPEPIDVNGKPYVLMIGRITEIKGLEVFLNVALRGVENLDFRIAGQGDVRQFAQVAKDCPRIKYHGSVTGEQRRQLIANASVIIMPSRFVEPFGGSGVEGMMCGVPLIASDIGGFNETARRIADRCWAAGDGKSWQPIVHGDNPERWANAIRYALGQSRNEVATFARAEFGLVNVGAMYDRAFTDIRERWESDNVQVKKQTVDLGWMGLIP